MKDICEMGQMMKENLSPAGEGHSPFPKKGESNDAAVVPTNFTSVEIPTKPPEHSQPVAVALAETRKSKMKTKHLDNKDNRGGPSQPAGEPEFEVVTESLSYESLRNL